MIFFHSRKLADKCVYVAVLGIVLLIVGLYAISYAFYLMNLDTKTETTIDDTSKSMNQGIAFFLIGSAIAGAAGGMLKQKSKMKRQIGKS